MPNLSSLLEGSAASYPDRTAVVLGETRLTYAQVDAAANQVANLLVSRGIEPGDKVALSCPNLPYFPIVYYGILKAGATVVPLNVLLKGREVAYHLDDSDAKAYFCFQGTPDLPIGAEGHAGFAQTDGCEHFFVVTAAPAAEPPIEGTETLGPALKGQAPVFETRDLGFGGTVVLLPRFEAGPALALMDKEDVTFFAGVPTMYWGLLGALDDSGVDVQKLAANMRVAAAGGSALPVEVHKEFEHRFGVTILEGYGLSETSPVASFSVWGEPARVGSIGKPIPGVEMKLINPDPGVREDLEDGEDVIGEIAIKGPNIMKGYYGRPDATADAIVDGWFRSGDLGRKDADGWYYIVDRSKDMIIRGGFNVYPRQVEEVLMTHPDVSLAAVIGVPHDSHGEEIKAVVIRNDDATVTEDELVAWSK